MMGLPWGCWISGSEVYAFEPEMLLLLTDQKDIKDFPPLFADQSTIDGWVTSHAEFYLNLWSRASAIRGCQIFQTSFVLPFRTRPWETWRQTTFSPRQAV